MSASQTLETYLAAFKRHSHSNAKSRPRVLPSKPKGKKLGFDEERTSVSTTSSIDTDWLLRSDASEEVRKVVLRRGQEKNKGRHRKNVHSMPLNIVQENSEMLERSFLNYNIEDYLPQASPPVLLYKNPSFLRPEIRQIPHIGRVPIRPMQKKKSVFSVEKQSIISSVDTEELLQSSDEDGDMENFPIANLTKALLDKSRGTQTKLGIEERDSISPRHNPVVSIGNTSRASPLPPRRDDLTTPLISPSPDLTCHTRTLSMPLSPVPRARKLSETTTVMVEGNNKQVMLCPSQRSEEKASLESTLQKCLGTQGTCFQEQTGAHQSRPGVVPGHISVTPKFNGNRKLQIQPPIDPSNSSRDPGPSSRPSLASSDPSEAFEVFCRDQLPTSQETDPEEKRRIPAHRKGAKTCIRLKVCTCILAGIINSHRPGCKVTTVAAFLPSHDSQNSSFSSLCNLKSGTTHSIMHSTGSRGGLENSGLEESKPRRRFSVLEAVIVIQRRIRAFLKARKRANPSSQLFESSLSMAYSRSTNDRSDIDRATRSIYSAIDRLQELKSGPGVSPKPPETDLLSMEELAISAPSLEANSDLLQMSGEQFSRVIRQSELHEVAQGSWADFLERESGETLWIDGSSCSIDPMGSKELVLS